MQSSALNQEIKRWAMNSILKARGDQGNQGGGLGRRASKGDAAHGWRANWRGGRQKEADRDEQRQGAAAQEEGRKHRNQNVQAAIRRSLCKQTQERAGKVPRGKKKQKLAGVTGTRSLFLGAAITLAVASCGGYTRGAGSLVENRWQSHVESPVRYSADHGGQLGPYSGHNLQWEQYMLDAHSSGLGQIMEKLVAENLVRARQVV